jgi:hypothetical protein
MYWSLLWSLSLATLHMYMHSDWRVGATQLLYPISLCLHLVWITSFGHVAYICYEPSSQLCERAQSPTETSLSHDHAHAALSRPSRLRTRNRDHTIAINRL